MIIMFVRHADAENDKLTEFGKRQCEHLYEYKEEFVFSKIYSSPAKRCVDTAKVLSLKFNIEVVVDDMLKEREQLKSGVPKTKNEKLWYDNYLNPNFESKNPEGCKNYLERIFNVLNKIIKKHIAKNENVAIVAHSVTNYAISAFVNGLKKDEDIKWIRVGNCSQIYYEIIERV